MSQNRSNTQSEWTQRQLNRRQVLQLMGSAATAATLGGLVDSTPAAAGAPTGPEAIYDFIAEAAKPYRGTEVNYLGSFRIECG